MALKILHIYNSNGGMRRGKWFVLKGEDRHKSINFHFKLNYNSFGEKL